MDELEEREGADFGAQCLFAASSTERLHSEDCRAQKLVEAWSLSNFEVGTQATIAPFSDVTPLIQQYLRELCRSWLRYRAQDEVEDGAQLFLSSLEDERLLALLPDSWHMYFPVAVPQAWAIISASFESWTFF